tara:strand:- start:302 stop:421 length:120 start_codon:yes stop_codon:yes gene_type:complete
MVFLVKVFELYWQKMTIHRKMVIFSFVFVLVLVFVLFLF